MSIQSGAVKVIVCDFCGKKALPSPTLGPDGWTTGGSDNGPGTEKHYWHACPECSQKVKP